MHFDLRDNEVILYLNYINLDNRIILKIGENFPYKDLFAKERQELDFINDNNYRKIFSQKSLDDFNFYFENEK